MSYPTESRFCKKHGYVSCDCPDEMGLSLAEYEAMEAVVEAADKFRCACYLGQITGSRKDLEDALKNLNALEVKKP